MKAVIFLYDMRKPISCRNSDSFNKYVSNLEPKHMGYSYSESDMIPAFRL